MNSTPLILASGSPRRRELLEQVGVRFEVINHDYDELILDDEIPSRAVKRIARHKAEDAAARFPNRFVLTADTIVVIPAQTVGEKDRILGKPKCEKDAVAMLETLQGRKHQVVTAFCIKCVEAQVDVLSVVLSEVEFRSLSDEEINVYVSTGEPLDKAGAYGIQGKGSAFIKGVQGSYTNIVGLPLCEVLEELKRYDLWSPGCLVEN